MKTLAETTPVALFGASGMLAGEFLRLCEAHPRLRPAWLASREPAALAEAHPHLSGRSAAAVGLDEAVASLASAAGEGEPAVAVLALPHGESARLWRRLRGELGKAADRVRVVDLAADYRLRDPQEYARVYGEPHPDPEELPRFRYALPELVDEPLEGAARLAAPGCFATAMQLAVVPAARALLLDPSRPWVLQGVTGSSGSGNQPKPGTHHPFREANYFAYSLGGHRHEAELAQALGARGAGAPVHFVAHSGPFVRGIHLTACLPLAPGATLAGARACYADAFEGRPFVEVLDRGVPEIRWVAGSNRACLALSERRGILTVLVALDNLVKGGAGQALQALNLSFGWPETWGLPRAGLGVA